MEAGSRGGSAFTIKAGPARLLSEVITLRKRRLRRLVTGLSLASGFAYWAVNAAVMGQGVVDPDGLRIFLRNVAIGVTFIAGLPAAGAAFGEVLERGMSAGHDTIPGVGRKTIIIPLTLSVSVMLAGAAVSAVAMRAALGDGWLGVARTHAQHLLPVGAGFALVGTLAGNLAGSLMLEARDLGRWTPISLFLLISHSVFGALLMSAVLHILWQEIGAPAP